MAQWRQSEVYAARDDPEGTACCSSRRPVRAHDSHTVSKSRAGVEMSLDTARRSACATSATNLAPHGSCSFLIDSEKPGDIRRSEAGGRRAKAPPQAEACPTLRQYVSVFYRATSAP